jgi:prepilin-type N-terminal cleavage/methylation domain-containing protein
MLNVAKGYTNGARMADGFTLVELIIVLVVLGILTAVVYRTIDATSHQSKFDATKKAMLEIINNIVGNPDLTSDGRRIDFGYVGDMGRIPTNLSALLHADGANWKGPYVSRQFTEDSLSFKTDAWGKGYEYDPAALIIRSIGSKETLTVPIADDTTDLFENRITGTILDINGAPPVEFASRITIQLTVPFDGSDIIYTTNPRADGYYEFTPPIYRVPIGFHPMMVKKEYGSGDSIVRWISVLPRSSMVADFRFGTSFRNNLKYVSGSGEVWGSDSNNVGFQVFNSGDSLMVDSLIVSYLDTTAYYEQVRWQGITVWDYTSNPPHNRHGVGDNTVINPAQRIITNQIARVDIMGFQTMRTAPSPPSTAVNMNEKRVIVKFYDGSTIDFTP